MLLDPLYLIWATIGYVLMFFIAAFVAPKLANKFSGRLSLYTSMIIIASLTIGIFSIVIAVIFTMLSNYFGNIIEISGLISFVFIGVVISNLLMYFLSPLLINLMYKTEKNAKLQSIVDKVKNKLNYRGKLNAVVTRNFSLPNAFAYGNFIFGKYVAVTPGMLNLTSESELEAVIGHEIGHHLHKDNAVMLLFGLLPAILYYLGYFLFRTGLFYRGKRESGSNAILAIVGLVAMLVSFIVQMLILAFSRMREYYSDMVGAKASGKKMMQYSLAKLHYYYKGNQYALSNLNNNSTKMLFIYAFSNVIANPLKEFEIDEIKKEKYSAVEEFLSSHPPIPKRLEFLDKLPY
ncbi:MAG: zinc metalloprotease HtpX [Candidatus Aenigmarchaeota archaeon]|nr:zinc metalloprotease HtpX [Candidatus Aenigmarchaeota archaeon]MDW8149450.1 zinc metalloprotease HtpX [Candidatus Aenigmarchaeota archaeon]